MTFKNVQDAQDALMKEALIRMQRDKMRLNALKRWSAASHEVTPDPFRPLTVSPEMKQLMAPSKTPWIHLMVETYAQNLMVEGYSDKTGNLIDLWDVWQSNRMDSRQIPLMRSVLRYGLAYMMTLPGQTFDGKPMPVVSTYTPHRGFAMFVEDEDEWPEYFVTKDVVDSRMRYRVVDDQAVYTFMSSTKLSGFDVGAIPPEALITEPVDVSMHELGVCPVQRFALFDDADDSMVGIVEPLIPMAARLNQTTSDRLITQRYTAFQVRTATGMASPDDPFTDLTTGMTAAEKAAYIEAQKLQLSADTVLWGEGDTKFGTLPAGSLSGYLDAETSDREAFAAVASMPPHYLLGGKISNLSVDAIVAAEATLRGRINTIRHQLADSYESMFRLWATLKGLSGPALDVSSQVRWADTSPRSLAQTADALTKMNAGLGIPVQMLWGRLPEWTQADTNEALKILEEGDVVQQLVNEYMPPTGGGKDAASSNGNEPSSDGGGNGTRGEG